MGGKGTIALIIGLAGMGLARAATRFAPAPGRATIEGTVRYTGDAGPGTAVDVSNDPFCADARSGDPLLESPVRTSATGGLRDVVVVVRDAPAGATAGAPDDEVVLDQVACEYVPRVLALQTGQTIVIRNSDRTLHNVHVTAEKNRGFNIGQPLPGVESRRRFELAEDAIDVKCDIHGWMHGTIFVVEHPYFTVTDADGRFTLPALPPGTYTVEAWHETLGVQARTVSVAAGGTTVSFTYPP